MQRWTVDAASLASLVLVVAATATLPPAVALSLACCELAFAASAAVRFSAHSSPIDASNAKTPSSKQRASSIGLPIFGRKKQTDDSVPLSGGAAHQVTSGLGETTTAGCSHAEQVADKLFDEREGHLDLLQGGHLLVQWFSGLAGPHQLHVSHAIQLLSYLLLPQPTQTVPVAVAAGAGHPTAAAASPSFKDDGSSSSDSGNARAATAAAISPAFSAPCPRIRSWASRLMELVHHHPQQQQPHGSSGSGAAVVTDAKLLACTVDPLVASYRPLVFYLLTEAIAAATHIALLVMGFRAVATPAGTAAVYIWSPSMGATAGAVSTTAAKEDSRAAAAVGCDGDGAPLVFLHGIGLGLTPYLRLLSRLVAASGGRRPVYAVQTKHVSMRLTSTIPSPHEVATDVAAFLAGRGVTRMSLLAHSYGTLIASALTKLAAASPSAPRISRLTLVDPVCFAMFLPHLVRNAIYQQPLTDQQHQQHQHQQQGPTRGFNRRSLLRSLIKGLVVAEFHCSVALRRRLDWARVNLWPSELPATSAVVLSGRDNLVPVREVQRILANRAARMGPACPQPFVLFREDLGHGGFLTDEDCQSHVISAALGIQLQRAKEAMMSNNTTATTSITIVKQQQRQQSSNDGRSSRPLVLPSRNPVTPSRQLPAALSQALDRSDTLPVVSTIAALMTAEAVWPKPLGAFYFLDSIKATAFDRNMPATAAMPAKYAADQHYTTTGSGGGSGSSASKAVSLVPYRPPTVRLPWLLLALTPHALTPHTFRVSFPPAIAMLRTVLMTLSQVRQAEYCAGVLDCDGADGSLPFVESLALDDLINHLALIVGLGIIFGAWQGFYKVRQESHAPQPLQMQQRWWRRRWLLQDRTRQWHLGGGGGSGGAGGSDNDDGTFRALPPRLPARSAWTAASPKMLLPAVRVIRQPAVGVTAGGGAATGRVWLVGG